MSVSTLTGHTSVMDAKNNDFPHFREMSIWVIFQWDLGSGRVCNGLEMAVGFKWTDSQPISNDMSPFCMIFMILLILRLSPDV